MANIVSGFAKLNDIEISDDTPVTTALYAKIAANINGAIDIAVGMNFAEFNSSGSWTAPLNCYRAFVVGSGSGCGSSGSGSGSYPAYLGFRAVNVTPGASYPIVIGAPAGYGSQGNASTFKDSAGNTLAYFGGGLGGDFTITPGPFGPAGSANSGAGGFGLGSSVTPSGAGKIYVVYWLSPS